MNQHAKLIAAGVILGAAILAHFFRFEVVATGSPIAYRLDRWTGAVTLLRFNKEEAILQPLTDPFDQFKMPALPESDNGPWQQYAPGK